MISGIPFKDEFRLIIDKCLLGKVGPYAFEFKDFKKGIFDAAYYTEEFKRYSEEYWGKGNILEHKIMDNGNYILEFYDPFALKILERKLEGQNYEKSLAKCPKCNSLNISLQGDFFNCLNCGNQEKMQ